MGLKAEETVMSGCKDVPHGIVRAANQRLWTEFGDDARAIADALITRPDFACSMAKFARKTLRLRASLKLARKIMGPNFIGPKEIYAAFGLPYGENERFELDVIPFQPSTLERCKDTHVLIAVFSLSLIELREREEKLFADQDWSSINSFVSSKGKSTWRFVRKTCVRDSSNNDFAAQRALLSRHEMVPSAHTVAYLAAAYFRIRSEKLFALDAVRCNDHRNGQHSCVGVSTGLIGVIAIGDLFATPFLGLASEELCDSYASP